MECPHCKQVLSRKCWSPTQWIACNPVVTGADGWERNCCNACSSVVGWYSTVGDGQSAPSPAKRSQQAPNMETSTSYATSYATRAETSISSHAVWATFGSQLEHMDKAARKWLSAHVPYAFWVKFYNMLVEAGTKESWLSFKASRLGRDPEMTEKTTLRKWLSRFGGVRPPLEEIRARFLHHRNVRSTYICRLTEMPYHDCSNWTYKKILMDIWPEFINEMNLESEKTIGDVLEAWLGLTYLRTRGVPSSLGPLVNDFIEQLEIACFSTWAQYCR